MKYLGLRTYNGRFVCAENGGGGEVNATRTDLAQWETFVLEEVSGAPIQNGSKVRIRTHDSGHYMCAENGGGGVVNATRTVPAQWETFTVEVVRMLAITGDSPDTMKEFVFA